MNILSELKEIGVLFRSGDFRSSSKMLGNLWIEIPEPKVDSANAYLVIEYGVALALKQGELEEAQKWADLAPAFAAKRQDRGEVEFLIGKVAFERGELEVAKANFLLSNAKSDGRTFEGVDEKYRNMIL